MRSDRSLFAAAQMAAAFAMFPTLTPPRQRRDMYRRKQYHEPGTNDVLMDWDLPKSKRAKRRARGRAALNIHVRAP